MLLEFACSNHRSIKGEVVLSMRAGKDTSHRDELLDACGVDTLRSAVVYGANGSGKSCLVSAFAYVKQLVMNSIHHQPGQGIAQHPHKLSAPGEPSSYRVHFVAGGVRYAYGFSIARAVVTDEYLYFFPNGRQSKIFDRDADGFTAGSRFRGKFGAVKDVLKPNRLLLSCAANFSDVPEVESAFRFFNDDLVVYGPELQDDWMGYSLRRLASDDQMKAMALSLLAELGTGIRDIRVRIDSRDISPSDLPPFLSDEYKALFLGGKADDVHASVVYDQLETDLFDDESVGVRKIVSLLCPLVDIMASGKVLLCDELESSLHESLVQGLVRQFVAAGAGLPSQLVLTSHETGLLSLDLFRRDQVWFTEMRPEDRSTDLYSLAEIQNVRRDADFGRGYISGKYGAIPMLNLDFARVVAGKGGGAS